MTDTYPMTASDPTPFVDRAYMQGQSFGWVRETYVNAVQAAATMVEFTTEWVAVRELGVHRRVILDDGEGMSSDELPRFFNNWGGSGQSVGGVNENYGYGSKVSLLPWNHYGVVVISRRADETSLLWVHRSSAGWYGIRAMPSDDDIDLMVVPLHEFESYEDPDDEQLDWVEVANTLLGERASGTAIILMGMTGREHTAYYGDPMRAEYDKLGIAQFLNSRFFELPIMARVDPLYPTETDDWPASPASKTESRVCHGLGETIELGTNDGVTRGVVDIPAEEGAGLAARIHWWLTGADVKTRGDARTIPLFGYRFSSHPGIEEIYTLETGGGPRLAQFVQNSTVRRRCGLLIEPINGELLFVYPSGTSRAGLSYDIAGLGGGHDLPVAAWKESWDKHLPKPIREAILATINSDESPSVEASIRRYLVDTFLPFLKTKITAPEVDENGEPMTANKSRVWPNGGSGRAEGRRRKRKRETPVGDATPKPLPHGDDTVRATVNDRAKAGLVQVVVIDDTGDDFAVTFDNSVAVATICRRSQAYQRTWEFLSAKYRAQGRVSHGDERESELRRLMEQAMKAQVSLAATELREQANEDKEHSSGYLSAEAMSATLMGIQAIAQAVALKVNNKNLPAFAGAAEQDGEAA